MHRRRGAPVVAGTRLCALRSRRRAGHRRRTLDTIDFLVHSRAAPGAADAGDDAALDEEHWSYMDRFAGAMTARGPTLAADRATWTGSLHIVDLPSAEAAREFAEREPYNRAGLFDHHLVLRFRNLLGRTMWEFHGGSGDPRFFVIAQERDHAPAALVPGFTDLESDRLIVFGELLAPDEGGPVGFALALEAPTREAVHTLLGNRDKELDVQVHDWTFGGRR